VEGQTVTNELNPNLDADNPSSQVLDDAESVWSCILAIANAIPDSALVAIPPDGAANHDWYLYRKPAAQ
jgi:hypothetical protein